MINSTLLTRTSNLETLTNLNASHPAHQPVSTHGLFAASLGVLTPIHLLGFGCFGHRLLPQQGNRYTQKITEKLLNFLVGLGVNYAPIVKAEQVLKKNRFATSP